MVDPLSGTYKAPVQFPASQENKTQKQKVTVSQNRLYEIT
jgi:hypothetical protein